MSENGLHRLTREIALVFAPLRHLTTQAQVTDLLGELGFELPGNQLFGTVPVLAQKASAMLAAAEDLADASSDAKKLQAFAKLLEAIAALASEIHASLAAIKSSVSSVPGFGANSDIDKLPVRLVDYLLSSYLSTAHRRIYGSLLFIGVLDEIDKPADAAKFQPEFKLRKIWWDRLPDYVTKPKDIPQEVYAWNSDFQSRLFLERLYTLFNAFLLPGGLYPQSASVKAALQNTSADLRELRMPIFEHASWPSTHSQFGVNVTPAEAHGPDKAGFALIPYVTGDTAFDFSVSENVELVFEAGASLDAGIGVIVRPGAPLRFLEKLFSAPADSGSAGLSLKARQKKGAEEIILLGDAGSSRLALEGLSGSVFVTKAQELDAGLELGIEALRLVVSGKQADGFIREILGDRELQAEAGLGIRVSTREGFTFTGSGGLEIQLPAHIELGPLEILGLVLGLKLKGGNFVLESGANLKLSLGPLTGVVENIGISSTLSFPDNGGNLGPANLDIGFKPPNGLGLAIDAGVVKGGGYLYFDFDKQEYAGAIELTVADFLSLNAIGLVTTRLPNNEQGFSLLVIITAEFNPGFQLGFGFTLIGVGGLVGLNRSMLLDPLVQGVRTGSINSILFPTNIVANAPKIISDLRAIFPPHKGTFLIGPMAKLGWGTPTLVSLALGVIIEIPGNVVILGRLRLAMPTDEEAVLVLQVSFVGALEFDKQRLWFFATLYDSHILFLTIEGEFGLLMDYGDDPNFVLTAGGFHPRFTAPALPFPSPKRIAITLVNESYARVRIEAYFAVTSNSVQMGCRADAFFGFDAFSVEGHFSFDALLRFSPFYLVVEISAGFSVKVFGMGVYGIHLRAQLEGPTPWHVRGSAGIEFLFFTFDVDVDVTFGERKAEVLPPIDVLPRLRTEFGANANWRALLPASSQLFVSLRDLGSPDLLVLHPVGTLQISQRFVPLNLPLDKVGNQKPSDVRRVTLSALPGALGVRGPVREKFAAGQYRDMDDAQKLSSPAYEPFESGLELGALAQPWATGPLAQRNVRYETIIIDTAFRRFQTRFFKFWDGLFDHFRKGSAVTRAYGSLANEKKTKPFEEKIEILDDRFTLAFQADNQAVSSASTFISFQEAEAHMAEVVRLQPELQGSLHVVPATELRIAA